MTSPTPQRIVVANRWRGFSNLHRALCAVMASFQLLLPSLVAALPSDGNVVGGQATIQHVNPNQLDIQQTTDKAILNWKSFSIAADESVHFIQPSIHSVALNRVVGADPSVILGQLQSNGRIFLLNPNGILFGAGAQIDVGGLLATTLQIRDEDFMAGRYLFAQDPLKGLKSVMNQGTLHVSDHGFVVLAAPGVSNEGMIVANLGKVVLGSGQALTVDLMGDGLISYALSGKVLNQVIGVDGRPLSSAVSNTGTIQADGGHVILQANAAGEIFSAVVNQSGVIRARSLVTQEGVVRLDGGDSGLVQVAGTLDASGLSIGQKGGRVSVLGQSVQLKGSASINASGDVAGGRVLVGGNYQGAEPESNAATTVVTAGASITADAISQGDGGMVIVWADGHTGYAGDVSAKGGQSGGNGGFVEVSGKNTLGFSGQVDTSAPVGRTGTLLLDPSDITISNLANSNISVGPTFTGTALTSNLNVTTLQTALGTNNVIVDTTSPFASAGNITVSNAVTWASGNFLELRAHNNITVNAGISSTDLGLLRLIGNQDGIGGGNVALNAAISSRLGGMELSGVGITGNAAGTITTTGLANQNAGNVTINATGAVSLVGAVTANGGTAGAGTPGRAGGTVTITGATGVTTGVITANGSASNGVNQAGGNGGTIQVTSTNGVTTGNLAASGGNAGTGTATGGTGGTIAVTNSGAGNVSLGTVTVRTGNAIGTGSAAAGSVSAMNSAAGAFLQTGAIDTRGGNNGTGGSVTLSSAGALQFSAASTMQSTGGTALAGTTGNNGGDVNLSGLTITTTGAITASGSNGNGANQAGGNAGTITVTSNGALTTSAGALTASGGNAGTGNAAGGNGGAISLTNNSATTGNITTGALTARTGNAIGTGAGGTAGSVAVTQNNATAGATLQTAAINTSGGTKGAGGAVVLNSASNVNVTSTITTTGGAVVAGGTHAGAAGGNVTITGVDRTVTGLITASGGPAVGTDQAGGNAGIVSISGTGPLSTTGGVTARTGAATGIGPGGVAGSITLGGTTVSSGALTTTGGTNGMGGNVSVTSTSGTTTLTTITASGGTANANTAGRNAGTISLTSAGNLTATTLAATGSNGNGANQAGGNGGTMNGTSTGGNVTVGAVSTVGGNGLAGNANGGNGGMVSLDAGGATPTITHQNITTTGGNRFGTGTAGSGGTISIAADALLSANSTLTATGGSAGLGTGGSVIFGGTVNGNAAGRTLTVNTNDTTTFSGAVGGTQALGSLTTNATGTVQIGGNVTTTGAQTYGDPVTLLGDVILTGTTPTFGSTVAGGGFNLALNFSGTTTINGANFTGINNFTTGNGGTTNLTGGFSTTGTQTYHDAVALTGATTMTSSGDQAITFNNTVNGAQTLAVDTTGTTTFGGVVGGTTALTSLTTNAGGTTAINGGTVTTTGAQSYNNAVTLGANTTLNAGAGAITFGNTLNGAFTMTANSTGATTFNGAVGNSTALTSLTTNVGGTTAINDGSVTTSGNQTYNDNVTMNQATTLTSTGGTVTFGGNATNNAAGVGITVDAPTINLTGGTIVATTGNGPISFFTDTLNPNGASINAGTGAFSHAPSVLTRTIEFGDVNTGRATDVYYGSNFAGVTAGSFTIGRPTHIGDIFITGVAVAPSALNIVNGGAGSVIFENAPFVSGNQNLGVLSGSGGISLGSNLTVGTGTLRLTTTGAIMQTAGTLTANTTGLSAVTGITLAQPTNNVTILAAQTTTGGIDFADTNGFAVNNLGATVDGFHPAIAGITANVGTVALQSGGLVTQTQRILASALSLQGGGPYQLTNSANEITTLAVNTTGNVQYNDANALTMNASTVSGNIAVSANDLTIGGPVSSTNGNLTLTGANTVTQSANLIAAGANTVTVTTTTGSIMMAAAATTTSGSGTITYTSGTNVVLGSLSTGGGVNVSAGGSVLSAAGSGINVTAGANSTLQALNGVVGTQAAPMTVNVNPGTLSIHATTAIAGISAFVTGTVFPGNALTLLNVPPGLVCFNGCSVPPGTNPFSGFFGLAPSFNLDSVVPWYLHEPSDPPVISVVSTYLPQTVLAEAKTDVKSDDQSVAREIPPCFPESACRPGASILAAPADGEDPELPAAK